jgi:hypothetical protein
VTRAQNLPFTELEWRDFERLCRRLALLRGVVEHALAYGTPGQAQYGIDILVRFADGAYEVWQTKRYKAMQPAELKAAVSLFLSHRWKDKARKIVLAVACNLDATGVVDAIEKARDLLASKSIGFELLELNCATRPTYLRSSATVDTRGYGAPRTNPKTQATSLIRI